MNGLNEMYNNDFPPSPSRRAATYHTQSLNRQGSRGFEQFLPPNGLYGVDETAAPYDTPRYNNDRMNATMQPTYNGFDNGMQHAAWNSNGFGQNTLAALNVTGRRPSARAPPRGQLPQAWLDPQYGFGGPQSGFPGQMSHEPSGGDDEELIPTAIVIKNIPFAVKKEQLVEIMTRMNLPLPYAFNYHFDNGVFRGLAFANFTTAEETQAVIQHMNGKDLHGRRLRVEYKKMLPQAERDRIEREKRERRGQLEEQHRPIMGSALQHSTSMSSITGGSMQGRTPSPSASPNPTTMADMNDPTTLMYWGKLLLFSENSALGECLDFPPQMTANERTIIHNLAHKLQLEHQSHGQGSARFVRVIRRVEGPQPVLSRMGNPSMGMSNVDAMRRGLHRAATTDFGQARADGKYTNGKMEGQPFFSVQDVPPSLSANALRAAKSHADLRSYTPSPSHSTASYPANPPNVHGRYDYGYSQDSPASSRPNLTPTMPSGSDEFLANGIGTINLNNNNSSSSNNYSHPQSPQRAQGLRQMVSWDRVTPGPIGGHRAVSANIEDSNRARAPPSGAAIRQPRGPPALRHEGSGFRGTRAAHRTRGSDELSSPNTDVDALVEQ